MIILGLLIAAMAVQSMVKGLSTLRSGLGAGYDAGKATSTGP